MRRVGRVFLRGTVAAVLAGMLAGAVVAVAIWPSYALVAAAVLAVALFVRSLRALAAVGSVAIAVLAVAVWPAFALLAAVVGFVVVLALHAPVHAFVLALLLFGVEGSIKVLLSFGGTPLPASPVAVGAAAIDVAFFATLALLVVAAGRRAARAVWRDAGWMWRLGAGFLAAWLAVSVAQVVQSGDVAQGAAGFRLTQAYVAAFVGGLVLLTSELGRRRAVPLLLVGLALIAGYAAARGIVGPSSSERVFALGKPGVTHYGGAVRAVGSFSAAVGLTSFLAPAAVFALALALLAPQYRRLGVVVFALAAIGVVASYARAGVLAIAIGMLAIAAFALVGPFVARRTKLVVALVILGTLAALATATAVATQHSPQLRERVRGFVNPLDDASMQMRFDTWRDTAAAIARKPLGTGVGTVGHATGDRRETTVTTDNSYLKIMREQGLVGAPLFVLAILLVGTSAAVVAARRRTATNAITIAALCGFIAFLVLGVFGEYVEQPGKVLAWTFLGMASAEAAAPQPARAPG